MKKNSNKILISWMIAVLLGVFSHCSTSPKIKLDPESQEFYEYARLVMTGPEKDIFTLLPDKASRDEFIADFWEKRDPDPETDENEFREEFFERIDYANLHFKEGVTGWKTDRGRIYVLIGPPDRVDSRPWINEPMFYPGVKGIEWWGYYKYQLGLEFIDTRGNGSYTLNQQAGAAGGLLEVIDRVKFGHVYNDTAKFQKIHKDFEVIYDESGANIYVLMPVESVSFKDESGRLTADFTIEFYIYAKQGDKIDQFTHERSINLTEDELFDLDELRFTFPYELLPGQYYFDVVVTIQPDLKKIRKIFNIKI